MALQAPRSAIARALVGGAAATAAMSAALRALQAVGVFRAEPPRQITSAAAERLGAASDGGLPGPVEAPLSVMAHLGFGLTNALAYNALRSVVLTRSRPGPAPTLGIGYALFVWLLSYQGWLPALNLLRPASNDDAGRQGALIVAHAVYGYVLDRVTSS